MMNAIRLYGYALLAGSLVLASSMPIAFKVGSNIPVITLLFYISLIGTVVSFIAMIARGKHRELKGYINNRRQFSYLTLIGLLSFVALPLIMAYATHHVSADLAAVVFRTWPIMLVLMAPLVVREKITRWDVGGVAVGFAGLFATFVGGTAISIPLFALPFVGLLLLGAFSDALSSAVSKRFSYELTSSIFVYNFVALLVFLPVAVGTHSLGLSGITIPDIYAVLFLGVSGEVLQAFMFYESLRVLKTSVASNAYISSSFITMLLGAVFLGEAIRPYYIVIAMSVVAGYVLLKLAPKARNTFIVRSGSRAHHISIFDVTGAFTNTSNRSIYNAVSGNGRALAFRSRISLSAEDAASLSSICGVGCIIFTDREPGANASKSEMNFIRDLLGKDDGGTIFLGIGDPDHVSEHFYEIDGWFNGVAPAA